MAFGIADVRVGFGDRSPHSKKEGELTQCLQN
jgi:hypothetical protein